MCAQQLSSRATRDGDTDRGEGRHWVPTLTQVGAGGLGGNKGKGGAWRDKAGEAEDAEEGGCGWASGGRVLLPCRAP